MVNRSKWFVFGWSVTAVCHLAGGQEPAYTTATDERLLSESSGLSVEDLAARYPAPDFRDSVKLDFSESNYVGVAETASQMSDDEQRLLREQGFVVSERRAERTFLE